MEKIVYKGFIQVPNFTPCLVSVTNQVGLMILSTGWHTRVVTLLNMF